MRGLAFPTAAVYEREDSCDHGTPFSSSGDLPQLDPAHSTPFDPAPMEDGANIGVLQVSSCSSLPSSFRGAEGPTRRDAKRSNESRIFLFLLS